MMFAIVKFSRTYDGHSYSGPSCKLAGVDFGKFYNTLTKAKLIADRLDMVNPVGWEVYEVETNKMVYRTSRRNYEQSYSN